MAVGSCHRLPRAEAMLRVLAFSEQLRAPQVTPGSSPHVSTGLRVQTPLLPAQGYFTQTCFVLGVKSDPWLG